MRTSESRFPHIAALTEKCIIWPMPREKEVFMADLGSATDKSRIHIYFYFFMKIQSTLEILTLLISNNRLSRSENLVSV